MSDKPKQKFIALCTPTLGTVSIWWAKAVSDIMWPMNTIKAVVYMRDRKGNEIAEVRNELVQKILSFESDDREVSAILWIDDDVIPCPGVLMQLASHDVDIATGVYFVKGHFGEPIIFPSVGGGTLKYDPAKNGEQKTVRAWLGSCGLSLIKTTVYKRMVSEGIIGKDKYGRPEWYRTTKGRASDITEKDGVLGVGGTEDAYFAHKVEELGLDMLVDLTKYAFGFHFDSREQIAYPEKQWAQVMAGEKVTWDTPSGVVEWD